MDKKNFQTIHEIGVSALMDRLKPFTGAERSDVLTGPWDNTSVSEFGSEGSERLLTASGIYLEGVHFDLVYTPLEHLGFKLMSAVAGKIYSMNGNPQLTRVDLAVPNKLSVAMVEKIFSGFHRAGEIYRCSVEAGDITASRQLLVISVHVNGTADPESMVQRRGGEIGDQICVTGDLGGALAGLRILLREKDAWEEGGMNAFQPDLQEYEYVVQRQLMPGARHDFISALSSAGVKPTSMIEVSQGLMNELQLLARSGEVGFRIFTPAVPIALETRKVADEMKEDVDRYAFYGGEDHEMLFSLKPPHVEKLKSEFEDFSVIGEVIEKDKGIVLETGEGEGVNVDDMAG